MKTSIKTAILLSAFALLSTGAFASNKMSTDSLTNEVSATVNYTETTFGVDVNIDKATAGEALITIYDAAGNAVLSDKFTVDTDTVQKSYLMTDVTSGTYSIEVTTDGKTVKHNIDLDASAAAEQAFAF